MHRSKARIVYRAKKEAFEWVLSACAHDMDPVITHIGPRDYTEKNQAARRLAGRVHEELNGLHARYMDIKRADIREDG